MNSDMTLAKAFDTIANTLNESGLTESLLNMLAPQTDYINSILHLSITTRQAFIIAALLTADSNRLSTDGFAHMAGVSTLQILDMQADSDALVDKGLIYCVKNPDVKDWKQVFMLPGKFYHFIRYNGCVSGETMFAEWSTEDVLRQIDTLIDDCDNSDLEYSFMVRAIREVLEDSKHLDFSSTLLALPISDAEMVLLLKCIVSLVLSSDTSIMKYQYEDILPRKSQRDIAYNFKNKTGAFFKLGLLETSNDDFEAFRVTEKCKTELLSELIIDDPTADELEENDEEEEKREVTESTGVKSPEVPHKQLFYNERESRQIADLQRIIEPDNFNMIRERMSAVGMRPGFVCLFHGSPGTGKTETALSLARLTGREIVQVNLATVRNCYVGESEKNVQKIFDSYRRKLSFTEPCPILLFNEADGIFGRRNKNVQDAVDQMENTLQNIMLQNLENFEGILIATTNLTCNLDKAFERRFLYKIEFRRPSARVRKEIWKSLIPELSDEDASRLAHGYDLTGAQIENVARKHLIASVLSGNTLSMPRLKEICEEESFRWGKGNIA